MVYGRGAGRAPRRLVRRLPTPSTSSSPRRWRGRSRRRCCRPGRACRPSASSPASSASAGRRSSRPMTGCDSRGSSAAARGAARGCAAAGPACCPADTTPPRRPTRRSPTVTSARPARGRADLPAAPSRRRRDPVHDRRPARRPAVAASVESALPRGRRRDSSARSGYDPFGLPSPSRWRSPPTSTASASRPTPTRSSSRTAPSRPPPDRVAVGGPGSAVVLENPTYIGADRRLPHDRQPADAHARRRRRRRASRSSACSPPAAPIRLAYVVPTFHNPTGATMPEARRRDLATHGSRVRVPGRRGPHPGYEPRARRAATASPPSTPRDRVITVGSLSKLAWGGLRIGWIRAPRADVDRLVAGKIVADHSTSLIDPGHRRSRPRPGR